jgi:uncharacterized membrane protein YhaH (DUF805 family)
MVPSVCLPDAGHGEGEYLMLDLALLPLKRYTDFAGRSRRKEYWFFVLAVWVVMIVLSIIEGMVGLTGMVGGAYGPLTALFYLGILIPTIAVAIRRMHDQDRSGWWVLCPILNIVFLFIEGTKGPNRFGPDPKGADTGETFS